MNALLDAAEQKMQKSIATLQTEFTKLRTDRAHASLLDHVVVNYYGNDMPINQVASISAVDARTLSVVPWDKAMVSPIDKAIRQSDLGLNPIVLGDGLRIPLPPLTEERRKSLIKVIRHEAEASRVAIRNIRRDVNTEIHSQVKNKILSEDEERRLQDRIQKLTDTFIKKIEQMLQEKEQSLLTI